MNSQNEVSLADVLRIYLVRWPVLLVFGAVGLGCGYFVNFAFPRFPAETHMLYREAGSQRLSSFLELEAIASLLPSNQSLSKAKLYELWLGSDAFFDLLTNGILERATAEGSDEARILKLAYARLPQGEQQGTQYAVLQKYLKSCFSVTSPEPGHLAIEVVTADRSASAMLANYIAAQAKDYIVGKEMSDLQFLEEYVGNDAKHLSEEIAHLKKQIVAQISNKQMITLESSMAFEAQKIADLQKKIGDVETEMQAKELLIDVLRKRKSERSEAVRGSSNKFAMETAIERTYLERSVLATRASVLKAQLEKAQNATIDVPDSRVKIQDAQQEVDYKSAVLRRMQETIRQVELQKVSVQRQFEMLELARQEAIRAEPGLPVLMLAGFILSQILACMLITLVYLFRATPSSPTKDQSEDHNDNSPLISAA